MREMRDRTALRTALRPIRLRLGMLHAVGGLYAGLALAVGGCLAAQIVSFFVPIAGLGKGMIFAVILAPILGFCVGLIVPVSLQKAAWRADTCGLAERVRTALECADAQDPMAELQRQDAMAHIQALSPSKALPMRVPRRLILALGVGVVCMGALALLPNPQDAVLQRRTQVKKQIAVQADALEKAADALEETRLTDEERAQVRKLTQELARKLREARDTREALGALDDTQQRMEKLQRDAQERRRTQTLQALSEQSALSGLANAMSKSDSGAMQGAINAMADALSNAQDAKELADALRKAAEKAPEGDIEQGLQQAAAAASAAAAGASGQAGAAGQQMAQALSGAMESASVGATGANLNALLRMARAGIAQASQGQGQGQGVGQGQGQGNGQGGQGQSQGQGQGAGSGAGMGTTQKDAGYSEGMSASKQETGQGSAADRVGAYERIYDPTRLGGDADASQVNGARGEGESQQIQLQPGAGDLSAGVPYGQVIGKYSDAAAQAMRRDALPQTVQQWVTHYFNALVP